MESKEKEFVDLFNSSLNNYEKSLLELNIGKQKALELFKKLFAESYEEYALKNDNIVVFVHEDQILYRKLIN